MTTWLTDIRYGIRLATRRPGLSLLAIAALSLGIGLTATTFSIVDGIILRGLPYPNADRLVGFFRTQPAQNRVFMPLDIRDLVDWRAQHTSFTDIAPYFGETVHLSGTEGRPVRYFSVRVSPALFSLLGVAPVLGRDFRASDDRWASSPVVMLSYRVWQDRFRGDPTIVGRTVRVNGETTTIIGVMPARFGFPGLTDVWRPLRLDPSWLARGVANPAETPAVRAVARLRDDVTLDSARSEMDTLAGRLAAEHPESHAGVGVSTYPLLETFTGPRAPRMLLVMLGTVLCVLLIACANVANLLLARALARRREVAIRTALGASRLRIVAHVLGEASVLAVVGSGLGLGLSYLGITIYRRALVEIHPPLWMEPQLDGSVLTLVIILTVATTLLAGSLPALRATRCDPIETIHDRAYGSSGARLGRLSSAIVIGEIALSCALLIGAGLMIRTIVNISRFDYGFTTANVFTANVELLPSDYPTAASHQRFYDTLLPRLTAHPEVLSAALTSTLPSAGGPLTRLRVDGEASVAPQDDPIVHRVVISPGYFDTLEVTPIAGRGLTTLDRVGSLPVAIVNESFANRLLPGSQALGRRIKLGDDDQPWRTVVGIIPDIDLNLVIGAFTPRPESVYVPLAQADATTMSIVVRGRPTLVHPADFVQDAVSAIDPTLPVYAPNTLEAELARGTWMSRIFGGLFTLFGLAALTVASIGLYGVMSFGVQSRTRELCLRLVLGARTRRVVLLAAKQGTVQLAGGVGLGLGLAALLSRGVRLLLFEVKPMDGPTVVLVVGALALVGMAACLVPAARISRLDLATVLRSE